jgi:hypothetical protein
MKQITKGWQPQPDTVATIRAHYPGVDHRASHERFVLYHLARGTRFADWDCALTLWIAQDYQRLVTERTRDLDGRTDDLGFPLATAAAWHRHIS